MKMDNDIRTLNLECVSFKACRDEGWTLEATDKIEMEYRKFLQIVRDNKGRGDIAPTLPVDRFWHHHILDTHKYIEDCDLLFGGYLHHFPYSGVFGADDAEIQRQRVAETVHRLRLLD